MTKPKMWCNFFPSDTYRSSFWTFVVYLVSACGFVGLYCTSVTGVPFFDHYVCDVNNRLLSRCSVVVPGTRNLLECVSKCNDDDNCIGSSTDDINACYKHYSCPAIDSCVEKESTHIFKSKKCDNGGVFMAASSACQCYGAWFGLNCEDFPTSDNVTILRHEGGFDFNKTWIEYRQGFVIDTNNLWIGLDAWNDICNAGYDTMHIVIDLGDNGTLHRTYTKFKLRGESDQFSYSYDSTSKHDIGPIVTAGYKFGNCLKRHENTPFSTWDRENDADAGQNCASLIGSGYWYDNNCITKCNFFGWVAQYNSNATSNQMMNVQGTDRSVLFNKMTYIHMYMEK